MGNQKLRKRRSKQNKQARVSKRQFLKSALRIAGFSTLTIGGININIINIVLPPQPRHHRVAVEPRCTLGGRSAVRRGRSGESDGEIRTDRGYAYARLDLEASDNGAFWCAVTRRHSSVGANPARQLSLQPVAVGADDGGNDIG